VEGYVWAGPVFLFVMLLVVTAAGLSAFMLFDTVRRPAATYRVAEPRLIYQVISAAYLLCVVLALLPAMRGRVGTVLALATPVVLAVGVSFLLRVVFPKPVADELEAAASAGAAPGAPEAAAASDASEDKDSPLAE